MVSENNNMFLDNKNFSTVIQFTPLVSIDLVVQNKYGEVLLGQRLNRPAKGFWFTPGGRIFKNETMKDAFKRISSEELGVELSIDQARLLGLFDHFYNDNVFGEEFGTHYVAIAYIVESEMSSDTLCLKAQHSVHQWFDVESLKRDRFVHANTKKIFSGGKLI